MNLSKSIYYGDHFFPWKYFIPGRDIHSIPKGGPIVFAVVSIVDIGKWQFQNQNTTGTFFATKMFDGWDGWVLYKSVF